MGCKSKGSVYVCVLCKPFLALSVTVGFPVFVERCIEGTSVPDWCICTAHQNVNWHCFVRNKAQGLKLEIVFKHTVIWWKRLKLTHEY